MSKHFFKILSALVLTLILGGIGATPAAAAPNQIECNPTRERQDASQKMCLESCDATYKKDPKTKDGCRGSCVKTWLFCVDKIKADDSKAAAKSIACHEPIVKCIVDCKKTKSETECKKTCFGDGTDIKKTYEACLKK
jgi:hypothetical protein